MMVESGETVTTEMVLTIGDGEIATPEPIEDEIEETCCSWDYDLSGEGDWD